MSERENLCAVPEPISRETAQETMVTLTSLAAAAFRGFAVTQAERDELRRLLADVVDGWLQLPGVHDPMALRRMSGPVSAAVKWLAEHPAEASGAEHR